MKAALSLKLLGRGTRDQVGVLDNRILAFQALDFWPATQVKIAHPKTGYWVPHSLIVLVSSGKGVDVFGLIPKFAEETLAIFSGHFPIFFSIAISRITRGF